MKNSRKWNKLQTWLGFLTVKDLESYLASYHCQHPTLKVTDMAAMEALEPQALRFWEEGVNARNFVQYVERRVVRDWEMLLQGSNIAVLGLK